MHEWFVIYKTQSTNKSKCAKLVCAWWKSSSPSRRLSALSNLTCVYLCLNQVETCSWQHMQMWTWPFFFFFLFVFTRRLLEFWPRASFVRCSVRVSLSDNFNLELAALTSRHGWPKAEIKPPFTAMGQICYRPWIKVGHTGCSWHWMELMRYSFNHVCASKINTLHNICLML